MLKCRVRLWYIVALGANRFPSQWLVPVEAGHCNGTGDVLCMSVVIHTLAYVVLWRRTRVADRQQRRLANE